MFSALHSVVIVETFLVVNIILLSEHFSTKLSVFEWQQLSLNRPRTSDGCEGCDFEGSFVSQLPSMPIRSFDVFIPRSPRRSPWLEVKAHLWQRPCADSAISRYKYSSLLEFYIQELMIVAMMSCSDSLVPSLHSQLFFACCKKKQVKKSWEWRLGTRLM